MPVTALADLSCDAIVAVRVDVSVAGFVPGPLGAVPPFAFAVGGTEDNAGAPEYVFKPACEPRSGI